MRPLTGEPDAGNPPVRFGGRGKVESLVPTPILSESLQLTVAVNEAVWMVPAILVWTQIR